MRRLALMLLPAVLAAQPDAKELLRQSGDAIKKYRTYELESIVLIEMHGGVINTKLEMPSSISVRRPDRMRIESRSQAGTVDIVSDGEHTWYYISATKKYIKRAATASPEEAVSESGMLPKNLPDVTKSLKSVKLIGEDTLPVGGEEMPCWKVETTFDPIDLPEQEITIAEGKQISWIRKSDGLSLQNTFSANMHMPGIPETVIMTQSTRTTAVRLNIDLPDKLFVFTPPAGTKETEDWTLPGIVRPDVIGKPAPNLKAKTIAGTDVDLASLHGKVILLDFWATWCLPCQRELPNLEKLHREFRGQGLVVVGLNVGENQSAVEKFLGKTQLSYPIALVEEGAEVVASMAVNAFPTVVLIDREGKVASYEVGARGEAALRADLEKLGITQK
jgi:thiol-disulfide isomerase/thioredoxin